MLNILMSIKSRLREAPPHYSHRVEADLYVEGSANCIFHVAIKHCRCSLETCLNCSKEISTSLFYYSINKSKMFHILLHSNTPIKTLVHI